MSALTADFQRDDLVTITITDGDVVHAWHGKFFGVCEVLSRDRGPEYIEYRYAHSIDFAAKGLGRKWVVIHPADDYSFPALLPHRDGPGWQIHHGGGRAMWDLDLPGLRVEPITAEGRAFLAENESLGAKRTRLIEQVRALSPEIAAELEAVIESLVEEADENRMLRERESGGAVAGG